MHQDRRSFVRNGAAWAALLALPAGQLVSAPTVAEARERMETSLSVIARSWERRPVADSAVMLRAILSDLAITSGRRHSPDLRIKLLGTTARASVMLAQTEADSGQVDEAIRHAEDAQGYAIRSDQPDIAALATSILAEVAVARGDDDASRYVAQAVALGPRSAGAVLALLAEAQRRACAGYPAQDVLDIVNQADEAHTARAEGELGFPLDGVHSGVVAAFGGCSLAHAAGGTLAGDDANRRRALDEAGARLDQAGDLFGRMGGEARGMATAVALYQANRWMSAGDLDTAHGQALTAVAIGKPRQTAWLTGGMTALAQRAGARGADWSDLVHMTT
jgi:hypothetical protein